MKQFSGSIFLLSLLAFNANAQTDSSNTSILSDVTITANRYAQKQNQTGKVVSIISAQQIERSAGKTLGQLLNEQAGITINGAFNTLGSNQSLYMRGAATGRTLVLIDGIPAFDPSLINSEFDLNLISLNEVERIEICRGAQSTIYGSDAIAGVINIITTKKNITKPVNLKASVVGGSFGTFRGNVQVYGKAGKLTYTTRYARLQNTGFSSAYDSTDKGGFDKDGYAGNQASAQLQYAITHALSVKTFVQYSGYKSDIDQSAFNDERDFTIDNQSLMTGVGMVWNGKKIKLNANYQYSDISRNYLNDSAHAPGFNKFEQNDYFGKNQFIELFGNITLAKGLTLLAGADYRHNLMNNQYQSLSMFGWYNSNFRDTSVNQVSGYGSLLFASANQKLHLELGGRFNHHSRYGNATTFTFNPSFLLHENYRLFGSIASGFKAPTLYQLFADFSGNPDLKAEKSVNYELGIQQQHTKISNRLVYFYRNNDNGIDYNYVTNKYFNFIEQRVHGIEWETQIKANEKINVTANYTWLAGQENTQSRLNTNDTTYTYLLRRPAHQLNLSIDYTPIDALTFGLSGRFTSQRNDVGGYQKADIELDPYFLLNAYGEYRIKKWVTIFANAQNLTNTRFFELVGYNASRIQVQGGVRIAL